ncbi:MAG: nicotinate-nucleotide adenylyltransferase [Nitrospirae bacterium]|nr:MAG: nicotinate-nucleotide adenylyltransferase [Nitrospirota bacterium]
MRIGLFGGTFNPIHRCHLTVAEEVQARLTLDQIIFIPAGDPPHKPSGELAPATHRLEMVKRAIENHPTFRVSDIEIRSPRPSYTIDTITYFKNADPATDWFFVVGLDAFLEFSSWKQASDLLALCHFVVCSRPGSAFETLSSLPILPPIPREDLRALDTGAQTILSIPLSPTTWLYLLALPPCPISASQIRAAIRENRSVTEWLPPQVESYIIKAKLYR